MESFSMPEAERIQKLLANSGYGSRRKIEQWIKEGKIMVNGKTAILGDCVTKDERITIDGKLVRVVGKGDVDLEVIAYNKPAGIVCSHKDQNDRKTVFEKLPELKKGRWVNIGRLDINTTGLLLFTNDGALANKLMHPSSNIQREYLVRVFGTATNKQLRDLQNGVQLDDGIASFSGIVDKGGESTNHWYHVVINEGRNREVRRLWESQGFKVSRLMRVRFGPYMLPRSKKIGMYWKLPQHEVRKLLQAAGLKSSPPSHKKSESK